MKINALKTQKMTNACYSNNSSYNSENKCLGFGKMDFPAGSDSTFAQAMRAYMHCVFGGKFLRANLNMLKENGMNINDIPVDSRRLLNVGVLPIKNPKNSV